MYLSADGFDVGSREVILGHDKFLKINVISEGHLGCVDIEDASLGLVVGHWELDLTIDTTRTQQGRIQTLNTIRRHYHLRNSKIKNYYIKQKKDW